MIKMCLLFIFVFAFSLMFGATLNEGFEGAWPPADWTNADWGQSTYGNPHSGSEFAYSNLAGATLTTLQLNASSSQNLTFWYRCDNASYPQDLDVMVGGDVIHQIIGYASVTYVQADISLSAYNGQTIQIKFVAQTGTGGFSYGICIDDIVGHEIPAPAYLQPTDLATGSITYNSASLDWTEAGSASAWEYQIDIAGFEPALTGNIATKPQSVTGLEGSTEYDWYVRSNYGDGNFSDWAGPELFTTLVAPITSFPYTESFDGTIFAPIGWSNTKTFGTGSPGIWDRQTTGSKPTCSPHSGSAMVRYNCYSLYSGTRGELVTKPINFPSDNYLLKFWMYRDTGYGSNADLVNVYYNTENTSIGGTLLGTINRNTSRYPFVASAGWYEYSFDMPTGATGEDRFIIFEAVSAYGNNIFIDDVTIEEIPVFSIDPTSKDFGTVNINTSSTAQTFTISNTGGGTLTITAGGISLTGTDAGQFSLTDGNSYPIELAADQSTTIAVAFAPTTAGTKTATLQIVDDITDATHEVALAGDGWDDSALPVSLSSFTAVYEDTPVLNWTTQSETNNLGFNLYRSETENGFENENFIQINSVIIEGMGTTSEPTNYSFVDEYPNIEGHTYYYWLESVSTSNELELFSPISIEIPISGQLPTMTILESNYPNPFNPVTTISFSIKENEIGILSIFNLKGQRVLKERFETGTYQYRWDATGYASGIYLYKLSSPTTNISKKMILMK
jgi:Secretion system C-terminal sorting domain/Abnormal spindle-like microcephaly-assoc'd, ASPM-SPD-2-Hydin